MRLAKVLGAIGRSCITAGVLLLLFVVYQLWGTGIRTAQAQNRLDDDWEQALDAADAPIGEAPEVEDITTVPPIEPAPAGEVTAHIRIPDIGVDWKVVEGVGVPELKKGPGHYPETPLPGQEGNAAIAGHRTTYGAPFNRLDELEPGDEIFVQTIQGQFRYLVQEQLIVKPTQVEVLEDKGDDRLTLTACHPKYSARERIVIVAQLGPNQQALPAIPTEGAPKAIDDFEGARGSSWPAILLGLLCAGIWFFAWLLGRAWKRWPAYAVGLPFFLIALFYFFEDFSRLLPANY